MNYVLIAGDKCVLKQMIACITSLTYVANHNYTVVAVCDGDLDVFNDLRFLSTKLVTVNIVPLGDVPKPKRVDVSYFLEEHPASLARLQPLKYVKNAARALYVDVDTLFVSDPNDLFQYPFRKNWLLCEHNEIMFCSSVLMYNLIAWKQHNVEHGLYCKMLYQRCSNDETALNSYFSYGNTHGNVGTLPCRSNYIRHEKFWECKSSFTLFWFSCAYKILRRFCGISFFCCNIIDKFYK